MVVGLDFYEFYKRAFLIIIGHLGEILQLRNNAIKKKKKKKKYTGRNFCSNFLVNVLAKLIYGEISQLRESVISKMHNFCLNNCWWNFRTKYCSFLNDTRNIDENSFWRNFCRKIFFDKILKVIFFFLVRIVFNISEETFFSTVTSRAIFAI